MAETTQIHPDKVRAYLATDYRLDHAAQRAVLHIEQRSERLAMLCADNDVKCGTLWSGLILSDHRKRGCPSGWDQRRRGAILLPSPNQGTSLNIARESDFVKPLNPSTPIFLLLITHAARFSQTRSTTGHTSNLPPNFRNWDSRPSKALAAKKEPNGLQKRATSLWAWPWSLPKPWAPTLTRMPSCGSGQTLSHN